MPCTNLSEAMRNLTLDPECAVTPDIIKAVEKFMLPEIMKREMKDGTEYYKLVRIQEFDDIIGWREGWLNNEDILASDRIIEIDLDFPIFELQNIHREKRHIQVLSDVFR